MSLSMSGIHVIMKTILRTGRKVQGNSPIMEFIPGNIIMLYDATILAHFNDISKSTVSRFIENKQNWNCPYHIPLLNAEGMDTTFGWTLFYSISPLQLLHVKDC